MSASAINPVIPPQAQGAGQGPAAAPAGAAAAFEALLGALFGGQHGLAAQVLANAAPGAKTDTAEDAETAPSDADGQAQTLANAMAVLPGAAPLLDAAATVSGEAGAGEAGAQTAKTTPAPKVDPAALPEGDGAKIPAGPGEPAAQGRAVELPPQAALSQPARGAPPAPAAPAAAPATPATPATPAAGADPAAGQAATPAQPATPAHPAAPHAPEAAPHQNAAAQTPSDTPAKAPAPAAGSAQPTAEVQARAATGVDAAEAAARAPQQDTADAPAPEPETPPLVHAAARTDAAHSAAAASGLTTPVRGSPETVAQLAANIVKKLEGRSTRFDVELEPAGLGRVDVRVEIGAHGRLTAALAFDNPHAAAELRSRAGELTRTLEQAGFDLSGGLSFDLADQRGQQNQAQGDSNQAGAAWRGRAFQAALDQTDQAVEAAVGGALTLQRRWNAGVDVRI